MYLLVVDSHLSREEKTALLCRIPIRGANSRLGGVKIGSTLHNPVAEKQNNGQRNLYGAVRRVLGRPPRREFRHPAARAASISSVR